MSSGVYNSIFRVSEKTVLSLPDRLAPPPPQLRPRIIVALSAARRLADTLWRHGRAPAGMTTGIRESGTGARVSRPPQSTAGDPCLSAFIILLRSRRRRYIGRSRLMSYRMPGNIVITIIIRTILLHSWTRGPTITIILQYWMIITTAVMRTASGCRRSIGGSSSAASSASHIAAATGRSIAVPRNRAA